MNKVIKGIKRRKRERQIKAVAKVVLVIVAMVAFGKAFAWGLDAEFEYQDRVVESHFQMLEEMKEK